MKAKMKDSVASFYALAHMIGRVEDAGLVADMSMISAFSGISKTTMLQRVFRMVNCDLVVVYENHWRGEAKVFHVALSTHGRAMYEKGMYTVWYSDWRAKVLHVAGIRAGSQRSIFI